jgi:hypothetical protein
MIGMLKNKWAISWNMVFDNGDRFEYDKKEDAINYLIKKYTS